VSNGNPDLVRLDRVIVHPLHYMMRHFSGNSGRPGDLGLFADGTVVYAPVVEVFDKAWTGSLVDLGPPEAAPESFVRLMAFSYWQRAATVRNASMILDLNGKHIVRFTGYAVAKEPFLLKVAGHIPHHVGLAAKSAWVVKMNLNTGPRADEAATFWRDAFKAFNEIRTA
jgi:hypothetical protein